MKILKQLSYSLTFLALAALTLIYSGCRTARDDQSNATAMSTSKPAVVEKGGAQLWGDNCNRCHNFRSPSSYSDAHWAVAMHHMRIRGNLTAKETEKILEFLKSAN